MRTKQYVLKVNEKELYCLRRMTDILHNVARRDETNIYKHLPLMKNIEKKIKKIFEEEIYSKDEDQFDEFLK